MPDADDPTPDGATPDDATPDGATPDGATPDDVPGRVRSPFVPTGDGHYHLLLGGREREVLRDVLPSFRELLLQPDDADLRRLFPPAYADDERRDREFREMVGGQLLESRFAAVDTLEDTLGADLLDDEQLDAWMRALNSVRLVLGTRLDVTEEDEPPRSDDPEAPAWALYSFLGMLVDAAVDAAAAGLPPEGSRGDG